MRRTVFRVLFRTAWIAWVGVALCAAPLLAAQECRQCCATNWSDRVDQANLPASPSCCAHHQPAQSQPPAESCPSCPKCQAQRPHPLLASETPDISRLSDVVPAPWPRPTDADDACGCSSLNCRESVDRAAPPLRVLFCIWRE